MMDEAPEEWLGPVLSGKAWHITTAESCTGGWGIVADDILAGILGWCVLAAARLAGYL